MSNFFDDVDEMGIVEDHVQGLLKLEDEKAAQILKRYRSVRTELRDRLDSVRADTFTAQQTRGTLAQVQAAIKSLNEKLNEGMADAADDVATTGIEDLISEIQAFSKRFQGAVVPINIRTQEVALDTSNFLLTQYESSISAYGEGLIRQLAGNITQAALMQMSYGQVVQRLTQFFDGEEWKLHRIVRTELHNIYNLGKINGMTETAKESIPDLQKTLMHPMDQRTGKDSILAAKLRLVADIDEPFRYRWGGKERVFMAPPDRPNDRAILVPYRRAWGAVKKGDAAFIPVNSKD